MTPKAFLSDETGAVTVDWVVLTASLVGLGLAVGLVVKSGVRQQAYAMNDFMAENVLVRIAFTGQTEGSLQAACEARGDGNCAGLAEQFYNMGVTELAAAEDDASFDDNWAGYARSTTVTGSDGDGNDIVSATWTNGSDTFVAGSSDYQRVENDFQYQNAYNNALAQERSARTRLANETPLAETDS